MLKPVKFWKFLKITAKPKVIKKSHEKSWHLKNSKEYEP